MSVEFTANVTVPAGTTLEATVYEDLDGDGAADNQETQSLDDGEHTYLLETLDGGGESYWIRWDLSTDDVEVTPVVHSGAVTA